MWRGLLAMTLVVPASAVAEPAKLVAEARRLLGVPYNLGGRLQRARGIDCQGVLFYALERVYGCGWKSYDVFPTRSVAREELGGPVEGAAPVASSALDVARLRPGDVVMMLGFAENPAEPALTRLEGRPVWVWHTGLYSGAGRWIVGDHFAGEVVETDLAQYLKAHPGYAGVFVTRIEGAPKPRRCRRHRPMRHPSERTD